MDAAKKTPGKREQPRGKPIFPLGKQGKQLASRNFPSGEQEHPRGCSIFRSKKATSTQLSYISRREKQSIHVDGALSPSVFSEKQPASRNFPSRKQEHPPRCSLFRSGKSAFPAVALAFCCGFLTEAVTCSHFLSKISLH